MTKSELLSLYRVLADDATEPYLLASAKANLFITEAEREGAERSLYLRTGAAYNIKVVAGKDKYEISPAIIFVDSAKLSGEAHPLRQTTRSNLDYLVPNWEAQSGIPKYWFIENNDLTLHPKPNASFTLQLDGSRRPTKEMETPDHLHEGLVYWVLHRAFSIPDSDLFNPQESADNLKKFGVIFGHKRSASFDIAWKNGAKKSNEPSQF